MDQKYVPYAQIESFYKYVYERRKANHTFLQNQNEVRETLSKSFSEETLNTLSDHLKASNLTVYDAANNIYSQYLQSAQKSV